MGRHQMNPSGMSVYFSWCIKRKSLGFLACSAVSCAVFGQPVEGTCRLDGKALSVTLAAQQTIVKKDAPIRLTVTVKNISEKHISLPPYMEPVYYWLRFDATDDKGRKLEWHGPEVKLLETGERVLLYPGYHWGRTFEHLEKEFDMKKPGKYKIRAVYGVGPDGHCPLGRHMSKLISILVKK